MHIPDPQQIVSLIQIKRDELVLELSNSTFKLMKISEQNDYTLENV